MAIISKLPEGADVLDLDAARVARVEARAAQGLGTRYIKLSAGFVETLPEVPLAAAYLFQDEQVKDGLALLLADPADVEVLWPTLTADDLKAVVEFISGKTPGESQA
jgi:hypothetical protein